MNTSKNTTGMILAAFLAVLGCAFSSGSAFAAESASYNIDADAPTYDEHAAGTSPSFQMTGGMTWRQTAPLASNSFQIVQNPQAQTSSAAQASTATSTTPSPSAPIGGHRGSNSSVGAVSSLHPAASSVRSVPRSRASVPVTTSRSSSASSIGTSLDASSVSSAAGVVIVDTLHPAAECPVTHTSAEQLCRILLTNVIGGTALGFFDLWTLFILGFLLGLLTGILGYRLMLAKKKAAPARKKILTALQKKKKSRLTAHVIMLLALASMSGGIAVTYGVNAETTVPQRYVYNGHLLNSSGQAITSAHSIRFSFWKSADLDGSDISAGSLNTGAATYAGWQEVATVTPDSNGYFSVQLGAINALPDLTGYSHADLQSLFLQVEVKAQAAPDTSYEVLDVDAANTAVDRSPILSVPFAQNADKIDQREIGTGSGSIPLLGPGGKLPSAAIPSSLEGVSLILDGTNSATGSIVLQFGQALAKTLSYDTINNRFNFNDSVRIQGNLTVLGLINGVDITALAGGTADALKVSSGAGLNITVTGGNYRLAGSTVNFAGATSAVAANATNYVFFGSGGLTIRTMTFPTDESYIPLAEVVTNAGAVDYIVDRRTPLTDDREELVEKTLHPEYPDSSYTADGTDNVGQLSVINDAVTLKNAYMWTSTRSTLQDYDIVLPITLPSQFVGWKTSPLTFTYKSSSADASVSKMDVQVFDTAGNAVTLSGTSTNLANTSWTSQVLDFTGAPTWTPGGTAVVRFRVSTKDNAQMMLGDLGIAYKKLTGN